MTITIFQKRWLSYSGLSPHKFMPMPGVHKAINSRHFVAGRAKKAVRQLWRRFKKDFEAMLGVQLRNMKKLISNR